MSHARIVMCLSLAMALSACGKGGNVGSDEDTDAQYGAASAILASKDSGAAALTKSLHENLKVENGILIVDGPIVPGAVVQSKNSPWSVSCGEGLAVDVGKGEIDLIPVTVQISEDKCALLTRKLGSEVQTIVDGKD
ncbi:MAG TPA: hypothetical protein VMF67_11360 [Rhizomicrobium sp.]|nr:hypothetical protein [Rhizomicrobium sp.]